jgi:large subunit ribosomal protein L19
MDLVKIFISYLYLNNYSLGVEISYELYNPTITKIEVLKLERRLDDNLAYLRDAPPEYCTFPFDMEPVKLPPGAGVPLNTIQVRFFRV